MKLALGTVQLGLPYGIANRSGQPDEAQAQAIVQTAWDQGLRHFDTAQAYGDSERVLGRCLERLGLDSRARVISKLDPSISSQDVGEIRCRVEDSLRHLGVPSLWAFLLHREQLLSDWDGPLGETLEALRDEGKIERLGVSVYGEEAALQALGSPQIDVVQVAANVFDRRFHRAGFFARAAEAGKQVFVRSVYLQGLALMAPQDVPRHLAMARPAVARFSEFCGEHGVDRRTFCYAYTQNKAPQAWALIGAETSTQCEESCRLARLESPVDPGLWDDAWPDDDPRWIDPSRWESFR